MQYIPDHDDSDPGVQLAVDSCKLQFPIHNYHVVLIKLITAQNRFFTCWLLSTAVSSTATILLLRMFAPGTGVDL